MKIGKIPVGPSGNIAIGKTWLLPTLNMSKQKNLTYQLGHIILTAVISHWKSSIVVLFGAILEYSSILGQTF